MVRKNFTYSLLFSLEKRWYDRNSIRFYKPSLQYYIHWTIESQQLVRKSSTLGWWARVGISRIICAGIQAIFGAVGKFDCRYSRNIRQAMKIGTVEFVREDKSCINKILFSNRFVGQKTQLSCE